MLCLHFFVSLIPFVLQRDMNLVFTTIKVQFIVPVDLVAIMTYIREPHNAIVDLTNHDIGYTPQPRGICFLGPSAYNL